jgi:uncharacterized RDD family membrane protein YckC
VVEGITGRHAAPTARAQAAARRVHGVETDAHAVPYIGLVTRMIAFTIDAALINTVAVIVAAAVALVSSILPDSQTRDEVFVAIGGVAFALWIVGYFVAFWTGTGETPGNRLMRIRVVRSDGSSLKPRQALVRFIGIVISAPLLIGFLPILVSERRRGLHDWLAGTVVIGAERRSSR